MDERLTLKITMEAVNSEGKTTVKNDLLLGEMKLSDVIKVEKVFLGAIVSLLDGQAV